MRHYAKLLRSTLTAPLTRNKKNRTYVVIARDFGLAFASAQVVHVSLVLWIFYLAPESNGGMVFFWVGIFCTYLLALISLPRLHDTLGPRLWRTLRTAAIEYIALVFAADFIVGPLRARGLAKYPLSYVPFALMLVSGVGLRIAAFLQRRLRHHQPGTAQHDFKTPSR